MEGRLRRRTVSSSTVNNDNNNSNNNDNDIGLHVREIGNVLMRAKETTGDERKRQDN